MSLPKFPSFTEKWHKKSYDAISPTRPELSCAGKNIVVTGGGTGVGKAIATAFAQAGASSVAILGRREDRLKAAVPEISEKVAEAKVLYVVADISKPLEEAFATIISKVGTPHILVSNAAVLPHPGPIAGVEAEELTKIFEINVFGALNAAKLFLKHATLDDEPIVLNISSALAHMAPLRTMGLYAASKTANAKAFDYLAFENSKVHVVNVQPGLIDSEMNYNGMVLLWDEPELAGNFCVWLASQEAKFLRGRYVWSNWDAQEMKMREQEIVESRLLTIMLDGVPM